jgi:hypothetical protein
MAKVAAMTAAISFFIFGSFDVVRKNSYVEP